MKNFVRPEGEKGRKDYRNVLEKIAKTGKCPFCKENFVYHEKPILKETKNWLLTESAWPYKNARRHFLIISRTHKEKFSDIIGQDFQNVSSLINFAVKKYGIKGGGLVLRFGEMAYSGSSVSHLHFHLISPEIDQRKKTAKVVNVAIG